MNEENAADLFDTLASAPRLKVLRQLVIAGENGMSAGQISQALGMSPSALSFHLSNMTDRGLITQEKQSRSRIYRTDFNKMADLLRFLLQDCCQGNPTLAQCCAPTETCCD